MILRTAMIFLAALTVSVGARKISVHNGTLPSGGKIWAFLVAGSNGYDNYRHQADVCHAYQLLKTNGIPDENIIVMMYDDVANSAENPTPGVIINRPKGPNVYDGIIIDYKGADVNPDTFLAVLEGNKSRVNGIGSGRVIQSGPDDHIFINFVDHGAPGLLCFPDASLYSSTLENALKTLAAKKKFSKMVLYVEACESGSMFDAILPDNMNIFVLTAADPRESSYACYYDDTRNTYLGDVFSVKWMEDADVEDLTRETIHHQYELVRTETNTSHVEEYGDLDVGSMVLALFLGDKNACGKNFYRRPKSLPVITDAVPSRDVPFEILKRKLNAVNDTEGRTSIEFALRKLKKTRSYADAVVSTIVQLVAKGRENVVEKYYTKSYHLSKRNRKCYEQTVQYFEEKCFKIAKNPYVSKHLYVFINMCSSKKVHLKHIRSAIDDACKGNQLSGVV